MLAPAAFYLILALLKVMPAPSLASILSTSGGTGHLQVVIPSQVDPVRQPVATLQQLRGPEVSILDEQFNVTSLLINKFAYLFSDSLHSMHNASAMHNETDNNDQSTLETRKIDQQFTQQQSAGGQQTENEYQRRNYFKILNRVFSRVDLPEPFRAPIRAQGGHCGTHIGCVEEIPNFPSLLRKANVSSSFTIYTRSAPKSGHKVTYEPIIHHQLQDANTTEFDLQEKLKAAASSGTGAATSTVGVAATQTRLQGSNNKRQTAFSWRTATKIIHSQEFPFDLASLEQSGFNASLNTRIIVGGYFAKEDEEWIDEVVRQWLLLEPNSNIIKVSWAEANRGLYHSAAYNSRIVGRQLTLFLYYLDQMFHIDLDRFHLVGHSLGAHIAGFVGADNEGRIARITGLDPAGPIFVELNASMRLDPSDAKFVDVVHTNGGTITKGALGLSTPSGHVDYYCNGGSVQPGCYFSSVTKSIMDPVERVACSHRRSYRYFIEIIKLTISEQTPGGLVSNHSYTSTFADNIALTFRDSSECNSNSNSNNNNNNNNIKCGQYQVDSQRHQRLPRAFLFEAKQDDLVRLMQPEIALMSSNSMRREISELAPLRRTVEFHLLAPEFPPGKRGMYFFRTRSETPFFASKQFALTLRTDTVIRRKMALMAKIDQNLVAEAELDEIAGIYTLVFAPSDPKILGLDNSLPNSGGLFQSNRVPQLSLMWRHRSFNLLLNQQNELHLTGLELSQLDSDNDEQPIIRYTMSQPPVSLTSASTASLLKSLTGEMSLSRNQWYKFDGRLIKFRRSI